MDAVLRRIEPWQFDEWAAMYAIEPWGDDWAMAATVAGKIHNCLCEEKINPADLIPTEENLRQVRHDETPDSGLVDSWKARLHL